MLASKALPGFRFHELKGDRNGTYAVSVTGNVRITFSFKGEDATDVDLEDYCLAHFKRTTRNYSNVRRDCAALEGHGLVEKDAEDRVFVPWSEVRINVAFGGDKKAA